MVGISYPLSKTTVISSPLGLWVVFPGVVSFDGVYSTRCGASQIQQAGYPHDRLVPAAPVAPNNLVADNSLADRIHS